MKILPETVEELISAARIDRGFLDPDTPVEITGHGWVFKGELRYFSFEEITPVELEPPYDATDDRRHLRMVPGPSTWRLHFGRHEVDVTGTEKVTYQ